MVDRTLDQIQRVNKISKVDDLSRKNNGNSDQLNGTTREFLANDLLPDVAADLPSKSRRRSKDIDFQFQILHFADYLFRKRSELQYFK